MKSIKTIFVISSMALGLTAGAQAFQGDVEVGYSDGDIESADTESYDISGTYYFSPVDNSKGPLAEAAFLDRADGLMLSFLDGEVEESGFEDVDTESRSAELHLAHDETGLYASLGYARSEAGNSIGEADATIISAGVGKYVSENGLLSFNYINFEIDLDGFGQEDVDTFSVDYKQVVIGDISYSYEASLAYNSPDNNDINSSTSVLLGATVYPMNTLGLGISYSTNLEEVNNTDSEALSLHARWFATEELSLALVYVDGESADDDFDDIRLSLNLRF